MVLGVSPGHAAARAGLVSGRLGGSECNSQLNLGGPRRINRWRDYTIRCLLDAADDGVVGGVIVSIHNFPRFSCRIGPAEEFVGGSFGECGGPGCAIVSSLNIREEAVCFRGFFR